MNKSRFASFAAKHFPISHPKVLPLIKNKYSDFRPHHKHLFIYTTKKGFVATRKTAQKTPITFIKYLPTPFRKDHITAFVEFKTKGDTRRAFIPCYDIHFEGES